MNSSRLKNIDFEKNIQKLQKILEEAIMKNTQKKAMKGKKE